MTLCSAAIRPEGVAMRRAVARMRTSSSDDLADQGVRGLKDHMPLYIVLLFQLLKNPYLLYV